MSVAEPLAPTRGTWLADDRPLYEVVNGEMVEMPPMSFHANKVASRLVWQMGPFANSNGLGEVVAEVLFRLPLEEDRHRNRRPDVAFVSYERWPRGTPDSYRENAWDVVPDLAVEVVSPNDFADELMEKVREYFAAGVRVVWVVYPRQRLVHVFDSLAAVRVVAAPAALDAGPVLAGLALPLADVFGPVPTDDPGPAPAE